MPNKSLSRSGLLTYQKYSSLLVGNEGYVPFSSDYELIATEELASSQADVTFSSLDTLAADYGHLQIRVVSRTDRVSTVDGIKLQFNGDSTGVYSYHSLRGDDTSIISYGAANRTFISLDSNAAANAGSSIFGVHIVNIEDFSDSSKLTSVMSRGAVTGALSEISLASGLWNNTAAVTSIKIFGGNGNFVSGSRFSIYGRKVA